MIDFSRNARAPFFGEWGLVRVRHGKAMRGSPAKQRTVLTVFDWAAEAVADWAERGLPRYGQPVNDLFPTEKGALVPERNLWQRMRNMVDELGFPPGLLLNSAYLKKYVVLYCDGLNNVVMRTAVAPLGADRCDGNAFSRRPLRPVRPPVVDGRDLCFNLSLWSAYSVMLMHTTLP